MDEVKLMKEHNLKIVRVYMSIFDAQVDKSVLDACGIRSMISSDNCGGTTLGMQFDNKVQLVVREEDFAKAIAALK